MDQKPKKSKDNFIEISFANALLQLLSLTSKSHMSIDNAVVKSVSIKHLRLSLFVRSMSCVDSRKCSVCTVAHNDGYTSASIILLIDFELPVNAMVGYSVKANNP